MNSLFYKACHIPATVIDITEPEQNNTFAAENENLAAPAYKLQLSGDYKCDIQTSVNNSITAAVLQFIFQDSKTKWISQQSQLKKS